MEGAKPVCAMLEDANLEKANLKNASPINAQMQGTRWSKGGKLYKTNLEGVIWD